MKHVVSWRWIHLLKKRHLQTSPGRKSDYIAALKQCRRARDLENGKRIHRELKELGLHANTIVANTLVAMYSRCRCMELALRVSEEMPHKDVVTWNALIQGYTENGEGSQALGLFSRMDREPNHVTFLAALKACTGLAGDRDSDVKKTALQRGKGVHERAKKLGLASNVLVASTLVDMYSKCGDMVLARETFEGIHNKGVVAWNCLLMGYVNNGESSIALELFTRMEDCQPNHVSYLAALKSCALSAIDRPSERATLLVKGKELHHQLRRRGFESHTAVANSLVDMYSKLGDVHSAREVFDGMKRKDVVTWNCLISGYVHNRQSSVALELLTGMDCQPDRFTYLAAMKGCASLAEENTPAALNKGKELHEKLKAEHLDSDPFVAGALVDMYRRCRDMASARDIFDRTEERSAVLWNSLILGYVEKGECSRALELYSGMDCEPDHVTFIAALKACSGIAASQRCQGGERERILQRGSEIRRRSSERGLASNLLVGGAVVDMYTKCGDMNSAREVFESLKVRDVVAWTCMILGYVENGESLEALELFDKMDCEPDPVTFVAALKACAGIGKENGLQRALVLHEEVKKLSFASITVVANALVDTFGKCGGMLLAKEVFDAMEERDVVSWNALFIGYVENGEALVPLQLFPCMDCQPNQVTFVAVLKACSALVCGGEMDKQRALEKGVRIHEQVKKRRFDSTLFVANTLIDMYSKCGNICIAREVFERLEQRDGVSWSCILLGCVENGESLLALQLYAGMDCKPNRGTFTAVLKACSALALENWSERHAYLEKGIEIHEHVKENGFETDTIVGGSLVDMYCKCGNMILARNVFSSMPVKDVITWTSIILGYVENKESSVALDLFSRMDCEPNHLTYFALLKACGSLADLSFGRKLHARVCRLGLEADRSIAAGLVHFYGRSGCMVTALAVFEGMHSPDIASWTGLIAGYGAAGDSSQVFRLVKEIEEVGLELSASAFAGILAACSHGGMVEQGERCFEYMQRYGVCPAVDHYTCMVDMFGRANKLDRAVDLVSKMPVKPDEVTWTVLLDACKKWKNAEVGKAAFDAFFQSGGKRDSAMPYVALGDLLSS